MSKWFENINNNILARKNYNKITQFDIETIINLKNLYKMTGPSTLKKEDSSNFIRISDLQNFHNCSFEDELNDSILQFSINFKYDSTNQQSLKNFSGSIDSGECIALIGASGCGKSTILRCLNGMIPEFYDGDFKGYVLLNNENINNLSVSEIGKDISFVFQDPRTQFFTLNSNTEVAFGLENFGFDSKDIREKVDEAFTRFNLNHLRNRRVFELSSGER